jgi:hypothetical protein
VPLETTTGMAMETETPTAADRGPQVQTTPFLCPLLLLTATPASAQPSANQPLSSLGQAAPRSGGRWTFIRPAADQLPRRPATPCVAVKQRSIHR